MLFVAHIIPVGAGTSHIILAFNVLGKLVDQLFLIFSAYFIAGILSYEDTATRPLDMVKSNFRCVCDRPSTFSSIGRVFDLLRFAPVKMKPAATDISTNVILVELWLSGKKTVSRAKPSPQMIPKGFTTVHVTLTLAPAHLAQRRNEPMFESRRVA